MTFRQFIDEAVKNSPTVQIAGEAVAEAESKVREARSQYLPQVNFGSSYTRISLLSKFDVPGLGHFKFGTPNNLSFRLGATEPVFTWGRVGKTVEMTEIGTNMAQNGVVLTKQMLAYQIVPDFLRRSFHGRGGQCRRPGYRPSRKEAGDSRGALPGWAGLGF